MDQRAWAANNLAAALLSGPWTAEALRFSAARVLGDARPAWKSRLVRQVLDTYPDNGCPPAPAELRQFLWTAPWFRRARLPTLQRTSRFAAVLDPARMSPSARFRDLDLPRIATPGDLADRFGLGIGELDWLADERRQQGRTTIPILQHYTYAFAPKASGPPRLIEAPKPRLKTIQRRILREILDHVPTHPCAHGFVAGRSCLSAAQQHAGEAIVIAVDLKDFFLRVRLSRVHALFRHLGYPHAVARALTGLCSTRTPRAVFERLPDDRRHDAATRQAYGSPHLPQGAPTSPALANLAAWRLDLRLHGLARAIGGRYTRYADDLAFSGDAALARYADGMLRSVATIASEEGFTLNARKTRRMTPSQRQTVTGIVVNSHCNVPRADYDALKATLHNCLSHGPAGQNRAGRADFRAHLEGRVGWVEHVNPARGAKLRRLLDAIQW